MTRNCGTPHWVEIVRRDSRHQSGYSRSACACETIIMVPAPRRDLAWVETAFFMGWGCNACPWKHRHIRDVADLIAPSAEVRRAFRKHTCGSVSPGPAVSSPIRTLEKTAFDSTAISAIVEQKKMEIARTRTEIDALRTVIPLLEDQPDAANQGVLQSCSDLKLTNAG
jgi:hypothetical protein